MNSLTTSQVIWLTLALVWSAIWKYWALWRSARKNDKAWFIVFCVVNTLGILEIIYLFAISKNKVDK